MRVSIFLASALTALVAYASAETTGTDDLTVLTAELVEWKASPAGQEALAQGYIPSPSRAGARSLAEGSPAAAAAVTADELRRFQEAKAEIARLSALQPQAKFSLNTPFALLTAEEFALAVAGKPTPEKRAYLDGILAKTVRNATSASRRASKVEPTSHSSRRLVETAEVDWASAGCVTPVQRQGVCYAGWAFAAVGAIESGFCAKSGLRRLYDLSEEDVLTCGTYGSCNGGIAPNVYDFVTRFNGGSVCTEGSLPYSQADIARPGCLRYDNPTLNCDKPDLRVASFVQQQFPDHEALERMVRERPVTAVINPCPPLRYYAGGVLRGDDSICPSPSTNLNNVASFTEVLIVGFGVRDDVKYWKIKNSLGTFWGEEGFGYLERGFNGGRYSFYGTAGVELWNSYPVFQSELSSVPFESRRCTAPRIDIKLLGTELKVVQLPIGSVESCCDVCRRESGCNGYYVLRESPQSCVLMATITGERRGDPADATRFLSGTVVPKEQRNQQCLPVEYHVDFPGNDVMRTQSWSAGECCERCFSYGSCNAYTWTQYDGGMCYMKSRRSERPEGRSPSTDGSAYFQSGVAYKCQPLQFSVDFIGEDLWNVYAPAPSDCCGACRGVADCAGFSWSNYNGGTCWLKKRVARSAYVADVWSAMV